MKLASILLLCVLSHLIVPAVSRAQWAANGNALCTFTGVQGEAAAIPDGAGGAIVVWSDSRNNQNDIFAQRVNAWGAVQWTANGVGVRVATNQQTDPAIVSDGAGGAIIFWKHLPNNGGTDIYAQRVNSAGVNQWTLNGVLICGAQFDQESAVAVSDGAGGAIVTWQDNRQGSTQVADVYAQRINSLGAVQWTSDGVGVCTAANKQTFPTVVADGTGGAIFAWSDYRGEVAYVVYTQRLNSSGVAQWTANGIPFSNDTGGESTPALTADGSGGAIAAWHQTAVGGSDIFAQRVNASGAFQWGGGGIPLCTASQAQLSPEIISDGAGGAIVSWIDNRDNATTNEDVYVQRVNASGVAQWTLDGVALCTAAGSSVQARMTPTGAGGAVVTWSDTRNSNYDVFAQRIDALGATQWTTDGIPLCTAVAAQLDPQIVSDGFGGAIVAWQDSRDGFADLYANRVTTGGVSPTGVNDTPALSMAVNNYPNPFSSATMIEITLDHESDVSLDVFDVAGRRVRAMNLGRVGAGARVVNFDGRDQHGKLLPSGVYFCRIHAGSATATRKMVTQR